MTGENAPPDIVTVVRLVPLGRLEQGTDQPAIVAGLGRACRRTDGDALFLVIRNESTLGRLEVGDIVHWVAEPFGIVWRAERSADATCPPSPTTGERTLTSTPPGAEP